MSEAHLYTPYELVVLTGAGHGEGQPSWEAPGGIERVCQYHMAQRAPFF